MTERPVYAELHAHSGFSFLDGSSDPEELVAEAHRLGLAALALTDHHGFYGVVRFAEAARVCGAADHLRDRGDPGSGRAPHRRARSEREPSHCAGPGSRGLCPVVDRPGRGPPRGRGEGPARLHPGGPGDGGAGQLAGAHRMPEGGGGRRVDGGGATGGLPGGGPPGGGVREGQCGGRAVGPRGSPRHGA